MATKADNYSSKRSTEILLAELAMRIRSFIHSTRASFEIIGAENSQLAKFALNATSQGWDSLGEALGNEFFLASLYSKFIVLITGAFWNRVTKDLIQRRMIVLAGVGEFRFISSRPADIQFFSSQGFARASFAEVESSALDWSIPDGSAILADSQAVTAFTCETEPVAYLNDWCVPLFCYRLLSFLLPRIVARQIAADRDNRTAGHYDDIEKSFAYALYLSWISALNLTIVTQSSLTIEGIGTFYLTDESIKLEADANFIAMIERNSVGEDQQSQAARTKS